MHKFRQYANFNILRVKLENVNSRPQNWGFWVFCPQNGEQYVQDPQKAHPWAETRRMTYRSSKSVHICALGASRRIKQKKVYLRNHNTCFSHVRPDHPRCRSAAWICVCGHTRDPIIYSKFHRNPFMGFGAPGGQNLAFPITLASRFYNSLYYRTSRDLAQSPPKRTTRRQRYRKHLRSWQNVA